MNSYINTWNIFAKANFIKNLIKNSQNQLIITKLENIEKYKKIFSSFKIELIEITSIANLVDFVYNKNWFFIVNSDLFYAEIPNQYQLENNFSINLKTTNNYNLDDLLKKLTDFWYKYSEFLEWWDYKKLWENLILKLPWKSNQIQISFWWDTIEDISLIKNEQISKIDQINIWKISTINLFSLKELINIETINILKNSNIILDNLDIIEWYEKLLWNTNYTYLEILKNPHKEQINLDITDLIIDWIEKLSSILKDASKNITIYSKNLNTIKNFIEYNSIKNVSIFKTELSILKSYKSQKELIICDDNLSKIFVKKRLKNSLSENIDLLLQIKPWDLVVHIDHWIGIFKEICQKTLWDITKQYIEIEYKNNDKLFVPITEIKRISKYIWKENPTLTWLSTKEWTKKLQKVSQDVEIVANELLEIYAKRKLKPWFAFKLDIEKLTKFQRSFDYEYTIDQVNAIDEILKDMSEEKPMERILVWDVGFWKTEVAFNAVYNAFLNKKQSVIISPLVVLAYEHHSKALERFAWFWLNIEVLTRFETNSQAKIILDKLKDWKIDLIIWTHRLLWENVIYKDLWLLIIDEEHKFWVKEKEQISQLKLNETSKKSVWIDILSMSATPIPRSLNMALNWVKDVSILSKAPDIRKWVETYVSKFDENIIYQVWKKEFDRNGQLFFIHNRVSTIDSMWKLLQEIFPEKKVIITHGQLAGHELEDRILAFKRKEYDILLSSTVIENWIDFPNVNTIIINDAYKFGISQLHQLRWRVWRSDKVWYCYLLFKKEKLKDDAIKRLQTMVEYSHLWAWFELAIRDLEIRWWWDILWLRQSWTATEIWINVFLKMLEEKIQELKSAKDLQDWVKNENIKKIDTTIDLNIWAYLDDVFFDSELDKINFYREIESINDENELNDLIDDFIEINWELSQENKNLFDILKLRIISSKYKIKSIKRSWVSFEINFSSDLNVDELRKFLDLDYDSIFILNDLTKIKTPARNFKNDKEFLDYLLKIMEKKKIKIANWRKIVKLTKN